MYIDRFNQEFEEHKQKLAEIKGDPKFHEQLELLKQEKSRKRTELAYQKARRDRTKLMKNLGRPKQALSAYNLYFVEQIPKYKTESIKKAAGKIAESWKLLNEDEKEKYISDAKVLKDKYKVDIEAWKLK